MKRICDKISDTEERPKGGDRLNDTEKDAVGAEKEKPSARSRTAGGSGGAAKPSGAAKSGTARRKKPAAGRGAPKYTPEELRAALERYFESICRTVDAEDRNGEPLTNDRGEVIRRVQYVVPPSVSGLCLSLGIGRSEWREYLDAEKHPLHAKEAELAAERIEAYLEGELVTRGTGVQGLIFNLQNNYGYRRGGDTKTAARTTLGGMSFREKLDAAEQAAEVSGDG